MKEGIRGATFALTLLAVTHAPTVAAQHAFIIFPEVSLTHQSVNHSGNYEDGRGVVGASFFYAYDSDKVRFLGEAILHTDEQEIERLQAGWRMQPQTTLWLGRYHNPLIHWNTLFHHGTYLQQSISRPSIAEFEDTGGVLQTHLTGGLLEGAAPIGAGELGYALALGAGSDLDINNTLEPRLLFASHGKHNLNTSARISYRADAFNDNKEAGLLFNRSHIFSEKLPAQDIQQTITGGYLHWEWKQLRLLSAAYWIHSVISLGAQDTSTTFGNGYAQLEYGSGQSWGVFARTEGTWGGNSDAYLSIFPDFVRHRNLVGVRYDFMRRQALKLEISNSQVQDGSQRAITLQWSGGFPFP